MSWRLCGNGVQVCNSMFSTKHVLMVLPRRQCGQYCRIQCCSLAFSGDVLPTEWMSEYWILCVCVFTLLDCKKKFCTCWGQARHNPRNLINWLCHKLLPFVFNNYHRSDNVIPYGLKNAVRELKEFLVSVWVTIFTKRLSQYLDYCQCFLAMTLGDFEAFEAPTWWFGSVFSIYFRFQKNGKWYNSYKNSNYWPLDARP